MKGIAMLLVISLISWGFWMSWQWLRNPKRKIKNNKQKQK